MDFMILYKKTVLSCICCSKALLKAQIVIGLESEVQVDLGTIVPMKISLVVNRITTIINALTEVRQ